MAYTNTETFPTDVMPSSILPRLLDTAARMAYDIINSRLALRYTVPFDAPYPSEVVSISNLLTRAIAMDLQAKRAPLTSMSSGATSGRVTRPEPDPGYKAAYDWLERVAEGKALLTGVDPIELTAEWEW